MVNGDLANPALSYDPDNKLYQAQMRVSFAFAKASKTGDIYNISKYANKNSDEFFAETFAMYDKGEELPDYIVSMIEEVLSFGKL
jgi:hypothetical protein